MCFSCGIIGTGGSVQKYFIMESKLVSVWLLLFVWYWCAVRYLCLFDWVGNNFIMPNGRVYFSMFSLSRQKVACGFAELDTM